MVRVASGYPWRGAPGIDISAGSTGVCKGERTYLNIPRGCHGPPVFLPSAGREVLIEKPICHLGKHATVRINWPIHGRTVRVRYRYRTVLLVISCRAPLSEICPPILNARYSVSLSDRRSEDSSSISGRFESPLGCGFEHCLKKHLRG